MRKLETKGNGWVRHAKVDFIKEGVMKGALHVEIDMGGDSSKGSFDDVADLVQQLLKCRLPQKRIVRFVGQLVEGDPNFTLLVKSLYDYGFELQAIVDDRLVYSWMQWINWLIVRTSNHVVMTQCDELWLTATELPEDVTFPVRANRVTFCYVTGKLAIDDVDAFMCRSRHQWGLL